MATRTLWHALCAFLAALLAAALPSVAGAEAAHPNIVLVLMDNYGYGEPGVYGGGELRGAATPGIDTLARDGLRLTNYNVEAECTPSRSALMTGRYAMRTRLRKGEPPRDIWYGLSSSELTIAEQLSAVGYATGIFGKWHLGDTPGRFPTDQGFDEWYGIPNATDVAYWPDSDLFGPEERKLVPPEYVMSSMRGQIPRKLALYDRAKRRLIDREITDRALAFMRSSAKKGMPFFAYVPFTQTHDPVEPHPDYAGRTGKGAFADVLAQSDAYVSELVREIDRLGLTRDTVFIFTSDNGNDFVENSFGFSGPWRGSMFTPYEGSLRVPFIIRWPGKVTPGRVSNEMVHEIDLFPTLARLAGAAVPTDRVLDGVDQSGFMAGGAQRSARESLVIYVNNELFGAKWRDWKMLTKQIDDDTQTVRTLSFASVYNLVIDPKEQDPLRTATFNTWSAIPLAKVMEDHLKSLASDPGLPASGRD